MKTFIALLTIASVTLASSCPNGTVHCAYNTSTSKPYATRCAGKMITGELKETTCKGSITIENCDEVKYKSDTDKTVECKSCKDNYRLHNNACIKCETRKGYFSNGTCNACDGATKYWDFNSSSCKDRTKTSISGCSTYDYYGDKCSECASGKALHDNGLKCGDLPDHCTSLESGEATVKCDECASGYWLDGTTCKAPTTAVANCMTYSDGTTCSSCKQGFMKKQAENKCNAEVIKYCSSYNNDETKCGSCYDTKLKQDHELSTDAMHCVDTWPCSTHHFAATGKEYKCSQCNDPYYWATNVVGTAEETDDNQNKYWNQKCTKSAALKAVSALIVIAFTTLF